MANTVTMVDEKYEATEAEIARLTAENERLRAIVRVNGLRWGHSHAEIDELLNQQQPTREEK